MSQSRKFSLSSGMAFLVLFVPLMLCCSSGALVHAAGAGLSDSVELFVRGETKVPYKVKRGIVLRSGGWGFHAPCLVEVDGLMVAISEAAMGYGSRFTVPSEVVSLAMEMSKLKGKDWKSGVPKTSDEKFVPQAVFNHSKTQLRSYMRIERPSVIVKGKKIYVYAGKFDTEAERSQQKAVEETWEPLLVVGDVRESGSEQNKTIAWQKPVSLAASLRPQLKGHRSLYQRIDGGGAGVAMEDGTLVFPVEAKDKRGRTISLIIYSKDDGANWTVSKGTTSTNCYDPSILEWERGTLFMVAKCDSGYRCMFESKDMGNTWTMISDGPLPHIWGNHVIEARRGIRDAYINATIDGKRVILFTLPVSQQQSGKATQLQLWATDMKNVKAIGPIAKAASDVKSSALLYTNGSELFSLHERGKEHEASLFLTKLDSQLEQIKAAVRKWKKSDVPHAHPYTSPALRHHPLSWNCKPRVLESGLIGFLSSNTSESYWGNERGHHEGATVRKADRVPCGFRFHGYGTGALWTVSTTPKDGQHQFTGDTFTLVANVQIHRNLYGDHPLLSVDLAPGGRKRLLGLLYTAHGNWIPRYGPTRHLVPARWALQRVYQVIMTVQNGQGFIYVDGEPLPGSGTNVSLSKERKSKMYFYFGGYPAQTSRKDIDVTVTNVLLYNRTMNASEIEELSRKIEVEKTPEEKEETVLSGDVDDTEEELTKSNNWTDEYDEGSLPSEGNSIHDEEEPIDVPPIFPTRKLSEGNSTNITQGEATHSQLNNETGKDSRDDHATGNKQLFSAKNQTTYSQKGEKMMSWSVLHDSAVRGYAGQTLVVFLLGFAVLC